MAMWQGSSDLPQMKKGDAIFQHKVEFTEVLSESVPQVGLHCMVLIENGLSNNMLSGFMQIISLVTSLVSICIAFGKVLWTKNVLEINSIQQLVFDFTETVIPEKQGCTGLFF